MPQYKTHARFNVFIALPILGIAIFYFFHPTSYAMISFVGAYMYATLFMNPDLDIANKTRLLSIRGILTAPFRFYSLFFRHRGISHIFFLGTVTRLLWLAGFFIACLFLINKTMFLSQSFMHFIKAHKPIILWGLAGIFLADICHITLDKISTK